MGIFKKVINEELTIEEAALLIGCSHEECRENIISYLKDKNKKLPKFLTEKKQVVIAQEKTEKQTEYIPSFEVVEDSENLKSEEMNLPDLPTMYKQQFFRALALQERLEHTESLDLYLQSFRVMQKYLDQMAEFDLQQKYSHKEQFDIVFKFMLSKKNDHPELVKEFIGILKGLNT